MKIKSGTGEANLYFSGFWWLLHLHATLLRGSPCDVCVAHRVPYSIIWGTLLALYSHFCLFGFFSDNSYTLAFIAFDFFFLFSCLSSVVMIFLFQDHI